MGERPKSVIPDKRRKRDDPGSIPTLIGSPGMDPGAPLRCGRDDNSIESGLRLLGYPASAPWEIGIDRP